MFKEQECISYKSCRVTIQRHLRIAERNGRRSWDLYSMHEVESDDGYQYNCIFATDASVEKEGRRG